MNHIGTIIKNGKAAHERPEVPHERCDELFRTATDSEQLNLKFYEPPLASVARARPGPSPGNVSESPWTREPAFTLFLS